MGLASGPMVAALFLTNDNYEIVIYIAAVALVVATFLAYFPAKLLDKA